jgi:hypothetical protein
MVVLVEHPLLSQSTKTSGFAKVGDFASKDRFVRTAILAAHCGERSGRGLSGQCCTLLTWLTIQAEGYTPSVFLRFGRWRNLDLSSFAEPPPAPKGI